jgi:hypothetical protein
LGVAFARSLRAFLEKFGFKSFAFLNKCTAVTKQLTLRICQGGRQRTKALESCFTLQLIGKLQKSHNLYIRFPDEKKIIKYRNGCEPGAW